MGGPIRPPPPPPAEGRVRTRPSRARVNRLMAEFGKPFTQYYAWTDACLYIQTARHRHTDTHTSGVAAVDGVMTGSRRRRGSGAEFVIDPGSPFCSFERPLIRRGMANGACNKWTDRQMLFDRTGIANAVITTMAVQLYKRPTSWEVRR